MRWMPKNRLNFPARFRAEMGRRLWSPAGWMAAWWRSPASKWEDMAAQLESCNLADARAVQHKLFPNAIEVTPDKQGRIQLTPRLLAHAGLEKDDGGGHGPLCGDLEHRRLGRAGEHRRRRRSGTGHPPDEHSLRGGDTPHGIQSCPCSAAECLTAETSSLDGIYLDGTAGGGGHSSEIARRLTTGHLYSLDQDPTPLRQPVHGWPGFRPR